MVSVKLTAGLAEALAALFAIVTGWSIWAWLRKHKAGGDPPAA